MKLDKNKIKGVQITKNRGWRGLAELNVLDEYNDVLHTMIFSFSQDVWDDLIKNHRIVIQDEDNYYILELNESECEMMLPRPFQQRSVLIKNKVINVDYVEQVSQSDWSETSGYTWRCIYNFIHNANNHTTSDWNYIGIRVTPFI